MDYLKLFQTHEEYEAFVSGGTMVRPNVSHCVSENEVHYNPIPHDYSKDYLTFVALQDGQFGFNTSISNVISYSLDEGKTWTELENGSHTPTVTAGNKIMWKGELEEIDERNGVGSFGSSGRFDVQGNVMSLLYGDNFEEQTNTSRLVYLFCKVILQLEVGNEYYPCAVVNAKNLVLPATTLSAYCYGRMFYNCTSLTTAPELLATTLAEGCYNGMFDGCTSLVTAPSVLPATTLAGNCYENMFSTCTSLTVAPELPATTLAILCYQNMFEGCTSLTTAPELPATTLAEGCYGSMFYNCTSLTDAPELPATTLADWCYDGMFINCTSLTTAPELPATTLAESCYGGMFYGCTNLNSITCLATNIPATNCTLDWVNGVSANGTFVKAASMTGWTTGVSGIPNGWTVQNAS